MTTRTTTARDPSHQIHHRHPDTSLSSQHILLRNRKISTSFVLPLIVPNFVTVIVQCLEGQCSDVLTERSRLFSKLAVCTSSASHIASHVWQSSDADAARGGESGNQFGQLPSANAMHFRSPLTSLPQNNLQYIAILEVLSDGEMHVVLDNMKWPQ